MRFQISIAGLVALIVLVFIWSIMVGAVSISPRVVLNSLLQLDGPRQDFIINRSRLPRSFLALMTGGALALSGAIIQALLRNPLASPKIIGINSGAALAVLIVTLLAPDVGHKWFPVIAAFGGLAAAGLVYVMAELGPVSPARLALIGVAVGFACDAGVDFILATADTYVVSAPLVWLTGSLWARGWTHVAQVTPFLIPMSVFALFMVHQLDLIRLGAAQATSLGQHVRSMRAVLLLIATLLAAISVSAVGVLGFVGLMAPHIARRLVGGQHRHLLPVSMLVGALLVLVADAIGRSLAPPIEISAGILTALLGAPFFIFIMLTNGSEDTT
ncbi:MAG: iron ABC transporter permease [Roseobacter sp.]